MNDHFYDPPSNGGSPIQEAILEQTLIFGYEQPERAWICTSWDTWEKNPYYHGPPKPHPEDDSQYENQY